jgi:hypothetical protein
MPSGANDSSANEIYWEQLFQMSVIVNEIIWQSPEK